MDGSHTETDFTPEEEWLPWGGNELPVLGVAHADLKDQSEDMKKRETKVGVAERKFGLNIKNNSEN